ncbi:hypothetical protein Ga0466249_002616 [Sporomusaceae bacterium BoRhaA]|uniref:hypothetical protein n=1 Tax=Pelorhabdus rhamnosifermentans TaxID=2772457 RepID=UPI001C05FD18|nr:hypothetical protein [Pelorhabdus rhamnosifermentans]MBU2701500.1 hypothetical protein [Pelorhabdus rhamnosifermentans]
MDIIWVFLLMALLYGLPELLRKKQRKTYDYPKVPKKTPLPEPLPMDDSARVVTAYEARETLQPTIMIAEKKVEPKSTNRSQVEMLSTKVVDENSAITSSEVATGIVWAEILAKPKLVRPYGSFKAR